jgi:hypothetical protein
MKSETQGQQGERISFPIKHPVIKARSIELIDNDGNVTLTLDGTHGIRLWGKDDKIRGSFGLLTTDRPALLFFHGPMPRVDLRLDEKGNPDFTMVGNRQLGAAALCIRAWDQEDEQKKNAKRRQSTAKKKGV